VNPLIFKNFGGSYQLLIQGEEDLAQLQQLDPARWAATSAPVKDLQCDPGFLAFLDPEGTGRIRVSQVVAARDWLFRHLQDRSRLGQATETLPLAALDTSHDEGQALHKAAQHVQHELHAEDRTQIALAQVRSFRASFAQTLANGDGAVPPEVIPDAEAAALVTDVITVIGSTPDASGKAGITKDQLDLFVTKGKEYLAWKARAQGADGQPDAVLLPWGDDTAPAAAQVQGLDAKLAQYFWQCDLLRHDPNAEIRLHWTPEELAALPVQDPQAIEARLAEAPLAPPLPDGRLLLRGALNPLFSDRLAALEESVLKRVPGLKKHELTRATWAEVKKLFQPYWDWQAAKLAEPFDKVDEARLRSLVEGELPARVLGFIEQDLAAKPELDQICNLEKLVLYQRWLVEFVNNFVNFSALFTPDRRAQFEMGTLVMDGRRLELTVKVTDRAAHKKVATESLMFVVYAQITEKEGGATAFEIAAPVTAGERGRLRVGKRGIFIGVDGKERDAVIVEILEQPISLLEAIKAPFRRLGNLVAKKVHDFTTSKLDAAEKSAAEGVGKTTDAVLTKAPATPGAPAAAPPAAAPPPPPAAGGGMGNIVMAGGIAIAALSTAMAFIVSALSEVNPLSVLGVILAIVLVVVGLSALLGWLKLRRRDLGLILEANGWALNGQMRLTRRLGGFFTRTPAVPEGSRIDRVDALAPAGAEEARRRRTRRIVTTILILAGIAIVVLLFLERESWLALLQSAK